MHACKTMLANFHFACGGSVPFSMRFDKLGGSDGNHHGMTLDQIEYIEYVQREIARQGWFCPSVLP
jgi:hypothetical protein